MLTSNTQATNYMPYEQQQAITRLCVRCSLMLMQYGAEADVIVNLTKRLGFALGLDEVQCSASFNTVTITTIVNNRCITTSRDTSSQGVNVSIVVQIQKIVNRAELQKGAPKNLQNIQDSLANLDYSAYPYWFTALAVAGSCSGYAYLNDANSLIISITFIAVWIAVLFKHFVSQYHVNNFVVIIATAFSASLIGACAYFFTYLPHNMADIAVASSVIFLIPSFALINALSDILKGYINLGMGRLVFSIMVSLSGCLGIVIALITLQIQHWGM